MHKVEIMLELPHENTLFLTYHRFWFADDWMWNDEWVLRKRDVLLKRDVILTDL